MIKTYRVTGKRQVVDAVSDALVGCGIEVLQRPSASEAPFRYLVRLPGGERLEMVCYAFFANQYTQKGRPPDEHRFQVKYGSDFHSPHDIYIDPKREVVTIFIGVHLKAGIFIGADPAMHNPTWFSSSVEFKTRDVKAAQATGWTAWERKRSSARQRVEHAAENRQTEVLIAFRPESMLRYIQLERLATGLDAGERLLLAQKMADRAVEKAIEHPLERMFNLSAQEILDVIWGRFRLSVAVRGGVAEYHLGGYLRSQPGITSVRSIDEDGQPDFEIEYKDRSYRIECKNVLRTLQRGNARVDFQKTRASKGDPCSRYYATSAFEVLAACLHPVTERWEYRFARTSTLDAHPTCPGRLAQNVIVEGAHWAPDIASLLR